MGFTQKFNFNQTDEQEIRDMIGHVYGALKEKGYNPISQMVGYILSGDPTYITGHNKARAMIGQVERDVILEVILKDYLDRNVSTEEEE